MRSILASMLVNMGDVVMMTAALDLIRQGFPGIRIGALVRPEAAELLAGNPAADEVVIYPYKSGSPIYGLGGLVRRIKDGRYDCFLSLDRRPRGAGAAFLAGLKPRIGPELLFEGSRPEFWTRLLFTRTVPMKPEDCVGSQVEMFQLAPRRAFGLEGRGRISLPPPSAEETEKIAALFEKSGPVIGLGVKTNDPAKTWPRAGFAALIRRLRSELGAPIYVIGAPADRPYVESLLELAGADGVLNLAGKTSLKDLSALAARSDLALLLDNGAAHLMANSGLKRLICLLAGTTPEKIRDSLSQASFIQVSASDDPALIAKEADLVFQAISDSLSQRINKSPASGQED